MVFLDFLAKFRQTNGYRSIAYTTYLGLALCIIVYVLLCSLGVMKGMGVLLGLIPLAAIIMGCNYAIIIFLILGIKDTISNQKTQLPCGIIEDIGVGLSIMSYLFFLSSFVIR